MQMARLARVFGLLFGACGVFALGVDVLFSVRDGRLAVASVGELWFALNRQSLMLLSAAVQRHVAPFLWDPVIASVLRLPAVLVFGGLAAALTYVGRRIPRLSSAPPAP